MFPLVLFRSCLSQSLRGGLVRSSVASLYKNVNHYYQFSTQADSSEGNFERKAYEQRSKNETLEKKRARLLYQSRKRGILENDLLLSNFAHKYLDTMSAEELDLYDQLINTISNEWEIFYWAVGVKEIPEEFRNPVVLKFIQHVKNEEREQRFRQPDLPL